MGGVAVVLCAGSGSRLRPHSEKLAKPLFPCAGIETIFIILWQLEQAGFCDVIINLHHLSEKTKTEIAALGKFFAKSLTLYYSFEEELLGSAGGLYKIFSDYQELIGDRGVLVYNGDVCSNLDFTKLINDDETRLALSFHPRWTQNYACLHVSADLVYQGISAVETTDRRGHFLGVHYLPTKIVKKLSHCEQKFLGLFDHTYEFLKKEQNIYPRAICFDRQDDLFWFSIDDEERLLNAQRFCVESLARNDTVVSEIFKRRYQVVNRDKATIVARDPHRQVCINTDPRQSSICNNMELRHYAVWVNQGGNLKGRLDNSLLISTQTDKQKIQLSSQVMLV